MITLEKKFRFEMAHRLAKGYVGKCASIHGHSWNGVLAISGNGGLDQYGMLLDYGKMKEITKKVEDALDHKLCLFSDDELVAYLEVWDKELGGIVLFDDNPTSEVLAQYIYGIAQVHLTNMGLSGRYKVEFVTIEETCTTACTYRH